MPLNDLIDESLPITIFGVIAPQMALSNLALIRVVREDALLDHKDAIFFSFNLLSSLLRVKLL